MGRSLAVSLEFRLKLTRAGEGFLGLSRVGEVGLSTYVSRAKHITCVNDEAAHLWRTVADLNRKSD